MLGKQKQQWPSLGHAEGFLEEVDAGWSLRLEGIEWAELRGSESRKQGPSTWAEGRVDGGTGLAWELLSAGLAGQTGLGAVVCGAPCAGGGSGSLLSTGFARPSWRRVRLAPALLPWLLHVAPGARPGGAAQG